MRTTKRSGIAEAIRQQVKQEVQKQSLREAMARDRHDYVNKLQESLIPALDHYCRYTIAAQNGLSGQAIADWQKDEQEFLEAFARNLRHPTKQRIDRRKALQQAITEMIRELAATIRGASAKVRKVFEKKELASLPENSDQPFWDRVWEIADIYYPPK